ncbi:hypothetical protein BGZ76_004655, partial [Entomortierella beljakovae]
KSGEKRPILSPVFHGFEAISRERSQICFIPCGTGFCIYDLKRVGGTGKAGKDIQETINDPASLKKAASFPRWESVEQVRTYIEGLTSYLDQQGHASSVAKLRSLYDDQVINILFAWFHGRLRPMISVIEMVIQEGEPGQWNKFIRETVRSLTDPNTKSSGNLCYELSRILKYIADYGNISTKPNANIREELRNAAKVRLLEGEDYMLDYGEPAIIEASFGRLIANGEATITLIDEPIAFSAAINFFEEQDPGLINLLSYNFRQTPRNGSKGTCLEYFSPAVLIPIFHKRSLSPTLFQGYKTDSTIPAALENKTFSIVGHDTALRGIRHDFITMEQYFEAHYNGGSVHGSKLVPPFFFPPGYPSGPDVVFILKSQDKYYPVFVQSKISKDLSDKDISEAHETVSFKKIKDHLSSYSLASICSDNAFFSLLFLPFHDQDIYQEPYVKEIAVKRGQGIVTLTQYTITINKNNIGHLIEKDLLKILNSAMEPPKLIDVARSLDAAEAGGSSKRKAAEPIQTTNNVQRRRKPKMHSAAPTRISKRLQSKGGHND